MCLPLVSFSYYHLSIGFTRLRYEIRSYLTRGILDLLCHRHNVLFHWSFIRNKLGPVLLREKVHKTLIHYLGWIKVLL
jgi:hypothetical protein